MQNPIVLLFPFSLLIPCSLRIWVISHLKWFCFCFLGVLKSASVFWVWGPEQQFLLIRIRKCQKSFYWFIWFELFIRRPLPVLIRSIISLKVTLCCSEVPVVELEVARARSIISLKVTLCSDLSSLGLNDKLRLIDVFAVLLSSI